MTCIPKIVDPHQAIPVTAEELARLRETAERFRWIPVTEELPDDGYCVLIALDDGEVWMAFYEADEWIFIDGSTMQSAVTHWCDLPPSPLDIDAERMAAGFGEAIALTKKAVGP